MSARITDVMVRKAQWAYEREITLAVEAGLSADGLSEARTGAIRAALEAALSTEPVEAEGWRDMSSEPLDGTEVIYWHPTCGQWIGNHPPGCARGIWRQDSSGEWRGSSESGNLAQMWRPLPAAPLPEESHHGR